MLSKVHELNSGGELAGLVSARHWSSEAMEELLRTDNTPLLIVDQTVLKQHCEELRSDLPQADIYYALKANSHPSIIKFVRDQEIGFEISSIGELNLLLSQGVPADQIISSNPLKTINFIERAYAAGIRLFAYDSSTEIDKLSAKAPGCSVCLRLSVSNEGSEWPLSRKFGVEPERAVKLLVEAKEKGLDPAGIVFHVGSQCTNPDTWVEAIEKSRKVWERVREEGVELRKLNLGGGFPIRYTKAVPSDAEIAEVIQEAVRKNFPEGVELIIEPGRALIGEAGILVTSVIAKAERLKEKWLYLDAGVFNGLMESVGGIKYPIAASKEGEKEQWVVAGPSCDGFDVLSQKVELPDLEVGEKVYILSTGAYTTAYASNFNGFTIPDTRLI